MTRRCNGQFETVVACGRRICRGPCGRWRHLLDFPPRKWNDDGSIKYVHSECYSCRRLLGRAYYARLGHMGRKSKRMSNRTWQRRKRRQQGVPEQQPRVLSDRRGPDSVPRAPLARWLRNQAAVLGVGRTARWTGLSERQLHYYINGYYVTGKLRPVDYIGINIVDRIATNIGDPGLLDRLYPLDSADLLWAEDG